MKTQLDASKSGVLVINGKRHKPRLYSVSGRTVELYPVRVLAEALHRTPICVKNWERAGLFPKPLFKLAEDPERRLYSRAQIVNLWQTHNRFPFSARYHTLKQEFFALIRQVFDELEHVVDVANVTVRVATTATARAAAPGGSVGVGERGSVHVARGERKRFVTPVGPRAGAPALQAAGASKPAAPQASKPGPDRGVVEAAVGRYPPHYAEAERRGHLGTAARRTDESDGRHPASAAQSLARQGTDYRRRPKPRT